MYLWRLAAAGVLLAACGGELAPETGANAATPDGAADGLGNCEADGIRICAHSEGCPDLSSSSCPGTGCSGVETLAGAMTSDGVCWSDAPDLGDVSCASCDDGQSCIRRGAELRCVANDLCKAFWDLGIRDVCTYADKHSYDGRDLPPEPATCPSASPGAFCGGACGECPSAAAHRCVGRSPDHPVGICVWLQATADPQDPSTIGTCSLVGPPYFDECSSPAGLVCGVFSAPASSASIAKQYGLCMPLDLCRTFASELPGGFECYDSSGQKVAP